MKGKPGLILFALPFLAGGLWAGYSAANGILASIAMQAWVPVDARLLSAGYTTHQGDDSTTYEAFAEYEYEYAAQRYRGNRVAIAGGADNIGDFQQDTGSRLSSLQGRGERVTVFVNPEQPSDAVIDRSIRWELVGFKSIFLLVFGGIGLGLTIFAFRARGKKDLSAPVFRDQPWLANDDWQTPAIKSNAKAAMWVSWFFAGFWNLVSAPLPFLIVDEVTRKDNPAALIGLLFPVIGIGLIVLAARRTREWQRFGPAPVLLDPFPGSIGGHVGGSIDLRLPYDSSARFSLTLACLRSYVSGSGKNRSRKETAAWQDSQGAQVTSGVNGTRLSFRFDVPDDLAPSDASQNEQTYYLWRLNLHAELPGVDIDRDYEIPVYPTRQHSTGLSGLSLEAARNEQQQLDLQKIRKLVRLSHGAAGRVLLFPMGRSLPGALMALLFGGTFAGIGGYLFIQEGHPFFGGIFGLVGSIIVFVSFYMVLNSLQVSLVNGEIRTVRRILGIPVKRDSMRVAEFVKFEKQAGARTQTGSKHVVHYSVNAVNERGRKLVVGEGFKGASQAETAAAFIGQQFGLRSASKGATAALEDYNFLAAD